MLDLIRAPRVRTVVWLAVLAATLALPGTAPAQDTASSPGLNPRLLADASWHGRPIQRPLPARTTTTDRTPTLQPGTGYTRPGGSRRVRDLQQRLTRLGYKPGARDGLFGPRTQAALLAFQRKHGLQRTGTAGTTTLRVLRTRTTPGAPRDPAQPARTAPARPTPAPTPSATTPRTPATPASSSNGFPLLVVLLILALALPLLMVTSVLVRRRTNRPEVLPALEPLHLDPPDIAPWELLPPAPFHREPRTESEDHVDPRVAKAEPVPPPRRVKPEKRPQKEATAEQRPQEHAEPQLPPYATPRITRRPPPVHGSPQQRRAALRERILAMRADGMTLQQIADQLTQEGELTLGGSRQWQPWSVRAATRPIAPSGRTPTPGRRDTS